MSQPDDKRITAARKSAGKLGLATKSEDLAKLVAEKDLPRLLAAWCAASWQRITGECSRQRESGRTWNRLIVIRIWCLTHALIFTDAIGESEPSICSAARAPFAFLGLCLDLTKNGSLSPRYRSRNQG